MTKHFCRDQDAEWMAKAISVAKRGRFTTTPNPRVGCLIVDANNQLVGQGAHIKAGEPHAEVHALKDAAAKAKGATAYVTLEPCSHTGKTPPCTDALIRAGVKRVVVANIDPNPLVSGRGMTRLSDAGIETTTGVLDQQARELNLGFLKRMSQGKPWVRVKVAASIDGRTALANGESKWITGPDARRDVQHYRAMSCAVVTGSGTVLADNPSLLVRAEQAEFDDYPLPDIRQPARYVMVGKRPLPSDLAMFHDGSPVTVVNAQPDEQHNLPCNTLTLSDKNEQVCLPSLLTYFNQQQYNEIWVEAGAKLAGQFIAQGLVDELIVYIGPKLLGDSGLPLAVLPQYPQLSSCPHAKLNQIESLGDDVKLCYRF